MKTHAVLLLAFLVACSSNNDGTPDANTNAVADAGPTVEAIAVVQVDGGVPEPVVSELCGIPAVEQAKAITLE